MVAASDKTAFTARNLAFWRRWVDNVGAHDIVALDSEHRNLHKATQLGLRVPTVANSAVGLMVTLFEFVRQRYYWEDWLPLLNQALRLDALPPVQKVTLFNQAGLLLHLLQRQADAIEQHTHGLVIAQAHARADLQLVTHVHLSNALYRDHQYERARAHALSAMQIAHQRSETPLHDWATIYNSLGLIGLARGAYTSAIENLRQAGDLFGRVPNIAYQATALTNLGIALERDGQLPAAEQVYHETDQRLAPTSFTLAKVRGWINLGAYYANRRQYEQALSWFQKANRPFLWRSADYRQQAIVAHNLGYVYVQLDRPNDGILYLQQAETILRSIDDKLNLGNTLLELGNVYARLQTYEQAAHALSQAVVYLQPFTENRWAQQIAAKAQQRLLEIESR